MNNEVYLSLLALDAYNRGYGQGVFTTTGDQNSGVNELGRLIGNARVVAQSDVDLNTTGVNADFYAIAYKWMDPTDSQLKTIISYRGTDYSTFPGDIVTGWTLGAGFPRYAAQGDLAIEFFETVTDASSIYDRAISNVIHTGHSLGGGLAGYIGTLSDTPSFGFNHMPFVVAATDMLVAQAFQQAISITIERFSSPESPITAEDLLLMPWAVAPEGAGQSDNTNILGFFQNEFAYWLNVFKPDFSKFEGIALEGEINAGLRNGIIPFLAGTALANVSSAFGNAAIGFIAQALGVNIATSTVAGEQLLTNHKDDFENFGLFESSLGVGNPVSLHSQSLLTILLFGDRQWASEGGNADWRASAKYVFDKVSDNDVGAALGLKEGETGGAAEGTQLSSIIAYSALRATEGDPNFGLIFGDTGIRALFNDADDMGHFITRFENALPDEILDLVGKSVAEFAGLLAARKILSEEDERALLGVLGHSESRKSLSIDLSHLTWSQYAEDSNEGYDPISKGELVRTLIEDQLKKLIQNSFVRSQILEATSVERDLIEYINITLGPIPEEFKIRGELNVDERLPLGLVLSRAENGDVSNSGFDKVTFSDDPLPIFVITGDRDNFIAGTVHDDVFITGRGNDNLSGGDGNDSFFAGGGSNEIWGGIRDASSNADDGDKVHYTNDIANARVKIDGFLVSVQKPGAIDNLYFIDEVVFEKGVSLNLTFGREIASGYNVKFKSIGNSGRLVNGSQIQSGFSTSLDNAGRISLISDNRTGGTVSIEGFNTDIIGSAASDSINDGSSEFKIINAGAGDDYVNVGTFVTFNEGASEFEERTVGATAYVFGGEGADDITTGSGDDVIVDFGNGIENPDTGFAGSVSSGAGDDQIVVAQDLSLGARDFIAAFSSTDGLLSYRVDAGEGDDQIIVDATNYLVTLNYYRGDGADTVIATALDALEYSGDEAFEPGGTLSQSSFHVDLSDYTYSELSWSLEVGPARVIWDEAIGGNGDNMPLWLASASLVINLADGGSLRIDNMQALGHGDLSLNGPPPARRFLAPVTIEVAEGVFDTSIFGGSPFGDGFWPGPFDPPPWAQPSVSAARAFAAPFAIQSFSSGLAQSASESLSVAASPDQPRIVGGGTRFIEQGAQIAFGGADDDLAIISLDIEALSIARSGSSISISDRWGVLGTQTFNDFDSFYVAETDQTLSADEFIAQYGSVAANTAPTLTSEFDDLHTPLGGSFAFTLDVSKFADDEPLSLSVTLANGEQLPEWLSFDGTVLAGLAPADAVDSLELRMSAYDRQFATSDVFRLTLGSVNIAPIVLVPITDLVFNEDEAIAIALTTAGIEDADGDALTFTVTGANGAPLPAWLSFADGQLSGSPPTNANGVFDLQLTASDGALEVADIFTLTLLPVNDAPVVVTGLLDRMATGGEAFSFAIDPVAFADADGDALSLTASLAGGDPLSDWLVFDGASLSGTPPIGFAGVISLNMTASDGLASVSDTFDLTIEPSIVTPPSLALSGNQIDENAPSGSVIGTLSVSGSGASGFSQLQIIETQLRLDEALLLDPTATIELAYDGTDTGTNNTGLRLTSMGRYFGREGQGAFTVWRIRNSSDNERTVRLNAVGGSYDPTFVLQPNTDTFVLSPVTGGSATHRLFSGTTLIDTKASSSSAFSFSTTVSLTNPLIVLDGNQLVVAPGANLDFERISSASVAVRATNGLGAEVVQTFVVALNDVLDYNVITGTDAANNLTGTGFADELRSLGGSDMLTGRGGNDLLLGGAGQDTALLAGLRSTYEVVTRSGTVMIRDLDSLGDGNDGTDTIASIELLSFKNGETASVVSPIILDLDGNGVETLSAAESNARFDLDGDGLADYTSWIGAGDAFLYLDRDGNGTMSGVAEISFVDDVPNAATDLAGLAAFDSNNDRLLDARDARFAEFGVWRDADGDGAVDESETASLATVGIRSINLVGTPVNNVTEFGEVAIANTGNFTLTNGATRSFADAALTYFSAATNLPALAATTYDFDRKAAKYRISAAGGALTVTPRRARSGMDPLAGQLGANTILRFDGRTYGMFAPVVLDLDGDGVELVSRKKSRASFDYAGDGTADDTGWVGRDDGFLVIDRNNDGVITEAAELSLASEDADVGSGLQGLARLDSNADGMVDNEDARFGELRIWQDRNGNGQTDAGELRSLDQAGIAAIRLNTVASADAQVKLDRNIVVATTSFVRANGTTSTAADVSLAYRPPAASNAATASLAPTLDRFGPGLFLAPFRDANVGREALLPTVNELVDLLGNASAQGITDLFDRFAAQDAPASALRQPVLTVTADAERQPRPRQSVFDPASTDFMMFQPFQQQIGPEVMIELLANDLVPTSQAMEGTAPEPANDQSAPAIVTSESSIAADPIVVEVAAEDGASRQAGADVDGSPPSRHPLLDPAQHELWGGPAWIAGLPSTPGQSVEAIMPPSHALRPRVDLAAMMAQPRGDDIAADAEIARKLAMIRQDMSSFGVASTAEIDRVRQLEPQSFPLYA